MDADSVSHLLHSRHIISDDDYDVITFAPNDMKMNCLMLQHLKAMNNADLLRFCKVLKDIETQQEIGSHLENCKLNLYACT